MENNKLYQWQEEALKLWIASSRGGIIEACTGSGKTMLGLEVIKLYADMPGWGVGSGERFLIVVPTEHLQKQWRESVIEIVGESFIGMLGASHYDEDKPILIAIVNSLRNSIIDREIIIMDECHRYASPENFSFLQDSDYQKILGLTATLERKDNRHVLLEEIAPVLYTYTQQRAVKEGVISDYEIIDVPVKLNEKEREKYDEMENQIDALFGLFNYQFVAVRNIMTTRGHRLASSAYKLMGLFQRRKSFLASSEAKIDRAIDILVDENETVSIPKTIIFCEFIKTAQVIFKKLKSLGISACIYHSKINLYNREVILRDFKDDVYRVIVCVKALDEGINVPELEVAIITSGSSVKRQMIQRVGRVLRKRENKTARIYQVYVENSQEVKWLKTRNLTLPQKASFEA